MLTITLINSAYSKPLSIEISRDSTLRDLINEVKRVCEQDSLSIPSVYSFAGTTWAKADLDKPLSQLIKTNGAINVNVKMIVKADDAEHDLHPDSLSIPTTTTTTASIDQPKSMSGITTRYILTDGLAQNFDQTAWKWNKEINNFITESKSFVKASVANDQDASHTRVLTISGRGSFEELCEWSVKLKQRYPQFAMTESSRQTGSDAINHINFHIGQKASEPVLDPAIAIVIDAEKVTEQIVPFPLIKQVIQGVLFDYMSIEEIRVFCKALEMDEKETENYIKEYQNKLFAQIEKEGFQAPDKNSDERLFNLHDAFIKLQKKSASATELLTSAVYLGDYCVAALAIKYGAEINNVDIAKESNLHRAAGSWGRTEIVRFLLAQPGIDVNAMNVYGRTALIAAACNNNVETLKLLLTHPGIQVNHTENVGNTVLSLSAEYGYVESMSLLLNISEIDINHANKDGQTPLILAAQYGHIDVVNLLLDKKEIDINHYTNYYKDTALTLAVSNGHTDIVKLLLLKSNIAVNHIDKNGNNALIYARAYEHEKKCNRHEMLPLIQSHQEKSLVKEKALIIAQGIKTQDQDLTSKKCHFNKLNADLGGKIVSFLINGDEVEQIAAQHIEKLTFVPNVKSVLTQQQSVTHTVYDEKNTYDIIFNAAVQAGLTISAKPDQDSVNHQLLIIQGRKNHEQYCEWLDKLQQQHPKLILTQVGMITASDGINSITLQIPQFQQKQVEIKNSSNIEQKPSLNIKELEEGIKLQPGTGKDKADKDKVKLDDPDKKESINELSSEKINQIVKKYIQRKGRVKSLFSPSDETKLIITRLHSKENNKYKIAKDYVLKNLPKTFAKTLFDEIFKNDEVVIDAYKKFKEKSFLGKLFK